MLIWLKHILDGLVSEPDALIIQEKTDEMGLLFTVSSTNRKDLGILIGRKGEHVNALRILLRTCGHTRNMRVSLKIIE